MMNIKFCPKKLTVKLCEIFISLPIFLLIKSKLYIQKKTEILTKPGASEEITMPAGKSTLWAMLEHPHITETTALKEQIYACHRSTLKYIIKNSEVLCTFESRQPHPPEDVPGLSTKKEKVKERFQFLVQQNFHTIKFEVF